VLAVLGSTRLQVQVGGDRTACKKHVRAVQAHPLFSQADIDFKLSDSEGPRNDACQIDAAFGSLRVRQVQTPLVQ
jgi:hypothetical protein